MNETLELRQENNSTISPFSLDVKACAGETFEKQTDETWQLFLRDKTPTYSSNRVFSQSNAPIDAQIVYQLNNGSRLYSVALESGKRIQDYFFNPLEKLKTSESVLAYEKVRSRLSENWHCHYQTYNLSKYEKGLRDIASQLRRYSKFKPNWDGEGGQSISWSTISRAIILFSMIMFRLDKTKRDIGVPSVGPLSFGGIEFEWLNIFKEFIFTIPNDPAACITYLKVDKSSVVEIEEEGEVTDVELVDILVKWLA